MTERIAESFEGKKTRFFVGLVFRYKSLYPLHQMMKQTARDKKYGVDNSGKFKRWGDPTQHCLVETAAGEILSSMIKLSPEESRNLCSAAFIHDWRKKGEMEEVGGEKSLTPVQQAYQKSRDGLLQLGIREEIIDIVDATDPVHLPNLEKLANLNQNGEIVLLDDVNTVYLAMYYLDIITRGSEITSVDQRMDYLDAVMQERYPYANSQEVRDRWGDRNLYEVMREIGHLAEERLASLTGLDNTSEKLSNVINQKLIEKISTI